MRETQPIINVRQTPSGYWADTIGADGEPQTVIWNSSRLSWDYASCGSYVQYPGMPIPSDHRDLS